MAYIRLEDLQKFPIRQSHYDEENGNEHFICGIETVIEYAENLPTADVAEVVRCKDCKYLDGKAPLGDYFRCNHPAQSYDTECDDQWVSVEYDDFCSCGERKEADDHGKEEQTSEDI